MAIYKDKNKTKDGRLYFFQVMTNGKLHKSKRYTSSKEAKKEEALYILKHKSNADNKTIGLIFLDYIEYARGFKKDSSIQTYIDTYRKQIGPFFDNINIKNLDIQKFKEFRDKLSNSNYSIVYLNKINTLLNSIIDYAIINYGLDVNLNKTLGSFKQKKDKIIKEKIRYITYDEFNQFIFVIDDITYKTFFTLLYLTGMRKGEVLALTFDDIIGDSIIVNKTLYTKIKGSYSITSTKNNINRIVKMDNRLKNQLDEYINYMKSFKDYNSGWFLFGGPTYLSITTIDRKKKMYFKMAGVKEITIHEFRHSHVSMLINEYLKSGQTDSAKFFLMMSQRLGHTIDVMQRTYMHLFPNAQDSIIDLLNNKK